MSWRAGGVVSVPHAIHREDANTPRPKASRLAARPGAAILAVLYGDAVRRQHVANFVGRAPVFVGLGGGPHVDDEVEQSARFVFVSFFVISGISWKNVEHERSLLSGRLRCIISLYPSHDI